MGRGRGRGGGGRGRGRGRGAPNKNHFIDDHDKNNEEFNEYYTKQGIVPEGEWQDFLASLRTPLPVTFRINGSGRFADHLRDKLQSDFFSHFQREQLVVDGEPVQPPRPLPWYPNNYAWHINFSRGQLRKMPLLAQIHDYMKKANEAGSISRQEAVSMVPPLFLDVQPGHRVLDMCAAPGSKTFQLLEALHTPSTNNNPSTTPATPATPTVTSGDVPLADITPQGFVVANDVEFARCSLLTHQLKRVCSPNLLVTNHRAEFLPLITDSAGQPQRYDRILCDVPCSGDGTMRKAPDIWRKWTVGNGNGLHVMQLRIALQGIRLLEVGGRMVYSTCTFNPIEDEAVIAEILLRCGSAVELCDVSDHMPSLKRLPGKHTWKVKDKFTWYDSWESARDVCFKLEPTMFPSPEKQALPLERCMRFLPHHQDTGGFFVAVFKKVAELPAGFKLPSSYRSTAYDAARTATQGAGEGAGEDGEEGEEAAPPSAEAMLAAVRAAAEAAVAAAREAVEALGAGEMQSIMSARHRARASAVAASRTAGHARSLAKRKQREEANAPAKAAAATEQAALQAVQAQSEPAQADQNQQLEDVNAEEGEEEAQGGMAVDGDGEGSEEGGTGGAGAMSVDGAEKDGGEGEGAQPAGAGARTASWIRGGGGRGREDGGKHRHIDPVVPVEDMSLLQPIQEYFGLQPGFPLLTQVVCRTLEVERPKRMYLISRSLRDLMIMDRAEQLKIIATGLKVFERQDVKEGEGAVAPAGALGDSAIASQCAYRITQEALPYLLPYVTRQRVFLGIEDFLALLRDRHLMLRSAAAAQPPAPPAEPAAPRRPGPITDPEVLSQLTAIRAGCVLCLLRVADAEALGLSSGGGATDALMANAPMALSAWRGKSSIAIMVDKAETDQMIEKIEVAQKRCRETVQGETTAA